MISAVFISRAQTVDDRNDQTADAVFRGTVRCDAQRVAPAVHGCDFTVDGNKVFQHSIGVFLYIFIRKTMGKNLNRTPDVVFHQLEFSSYVFGKFSYIQLTVHEENSDHSG